MRAETREAPEGKAPTGGGLRRCTNEAVRATRPSEFDSRFRLAEAQCFLQHSGRTLCDDLGCGTPLNQPRPLAEPIPALVRFRLPALHGQPLHGQDGEIRVRAYESRPPIALVRGRSQFVVSYRRT